MGFLKKFSIQMTKYHLCFKYSSILANLSSSTCFAKSCSVAPVQFLKVNKLSEFDENV